MLDSVCGCQGGQGLSGEWGPGTPTASSPAPAVYWPQELWSLLSIITVVQNTFFSPKCQNSIFFPLPCSRKCLNCFCENFPQNFRLRQMLSVGNIRVKSLALQKDRGEG